MAHLELMATLINSFSAHNVNITIPFPVGTKPASTHGTQQQAAMARGSMVERIDLECTVIEIHDNFVIGRTAAGETFTRAKYERVFTAIQPHINGRFYLVLDEVYPYAIELDALFALRDNPTIIGLCVVAYRNITRVVLKSAKDIIKKPVFFFGTLEAAMQFAAQHQDED